MRPQTHARPRRSSALGALTTAMTARRSATAAAQQAAPLRSGARVRRRRGRAAAEGATHAARHHAAPERPRRAQRRASAARSPAPRRPHRHAASAAAARRLEDDRQGPHLRRGRFTPALPHRTAPTPRPSASASPATARPRPRAATRRPAERLPPGARVVVRPRPVRQHARLRRHADRRHDRRRAQVAAVRHEARRCATRPRIVARPVIDRGPYVGGREFDLTAATKQRLGLRLDRHGPRSPTSTAHGRRAPAAGVAAELAFGVADGPDRAPRPRRVLRERRAAAPPRAARAAGDRVGQRAAGGRDDRVLRGAASSASARRCRRRARGGCARDAILIPPDFDGLPRGVARRSWSSCARTSSASRWSASTRPTSTSTGSSSPRAAMRRLVADDPRGDRPDRSVGIGPEQARREGRLGRREARAASSC